MPAPADMANSAIDVLPSLSVHLLFTYKTKYLRKSGKYAIFEYILYSNMKLNEYGIFEYLKNPDSLDALSTG